MLSNEMKHTKHQIYILNNKYAELQQDILILKQQASKKVLDEAYAHLLIPFTRKYEDEFEKNRSNTNQTAFHSYKRNLRKILSDCSVSDNSLEILNKIINEFVDETNISKKDFINLLLNKIEPNYHAYHIIDDYIEDLMSNQTATNNIIEYLEDQYSMNLVIQTNDQINLQKLIKLNIKIKAEEKSLDAFPDRYFDIKQDPDHMTDGSFRMPIVEKYEENGTIITGKIESGRVCVGDRCVILPNEVNWCGYGRNVRITLKNVQEKVYFLFLFIVFFKQIF
ncbi:hypothetical protein I4U23_009644 [Adineta vaga]|nr:hypothetical protein I4U23_009644 [Adineta vaga]